jgi:hypothetical protein
MRKIVSVLVVIMLVLLVNSVTAAEIDIEFKGGIGARVIFTNKEPSKLQNIDWSADLNGGLFELIHVSQGGAIDEFNPEEQLSIRLPVFGLGKATLSGSAVISEETPIYSQTRVFVCGFFVIILGE